MCCNCVHYEYISMFYGSCLLHCPMFPADIVPSTAKCACFINRDKCAVSYSSTNYNYMR